MFDKTSSYTLFSFILACYQEIEICDFEDIVPLNNDIDLNFIIKDRPILNFSYFFSCLQVNKILDAFDNKRIISQVLLWIDSNIYNFEDYEQLLVKDHQTDFENEKYYLVIQSRNSIYKQLNKLLSGTSFEHLYLRRKKNFDPLKNSVRLGIKNFKFLRKQEDFILKQKFIYIENLSSNLQKGELSISFYPTVCKRQYDELYKINKHIETQTFSIEYLYKTKRFIDSIKNAVASDADIKVFPEIVFESKRYSEVNEILVKNKKDIASILVAGTSWQNGNNILHVFNETGEEILSQHKFIPYIKKESLNEIDINLFEGLKNKIIGVNLLHVVDFGLIGFLICSDLNSNKYIESILCECGIDMLITSCMSDSDDIFSSLNELSKRYGMTIIACNTCISKKKYPALIFVPTKKRTSRECKVTKKRCRKINKCSFCSGIHQKITLKS